MSFLPCMMPEAEIFFGMYPHTDILWIWDSHGSKDSYCGLLVMTTYSIVGGYQYFGGTQPHLQGRQCVPPCQYPPITITGNHNVNLWICEFRDVPQLPHVAYSVNVPWSFVVITEKWYMIMYAILQLILAFIHNWCYLCQELLFKNVYSNCTYEIKL
jgi:hypothetical protein